MPNIFHHEPLHPAFPNEFPTLRLLPYENPTPRAISTSGEPRLSFSSMIKKVASAQVRVPDYPRVCFFKKSTDDPHKVIDVTEQVARLELEENGNGISALVRLDGN